MNVMTLVASLLSVDLDSALTTMLALTAHVTMATQASASTQ